MVQIYFKKNIAVSKIQPKKETVSFLLQFSKAFSVLKVGNQKIEVIAN
jgi:hypothetical protein